jgi:serine/threonine protein kinase
MNFEEMIETRDARKTTKVRMPYGNFYKRLIDGRYSNFVEFHDELADNIFFEKSIKAEYESLGSINQKAQLHFMPNEGEDDGIYAIAVEVGNYLTVEQALNEDPAIVARSQFVKQTLRELMDFTSYINEQGIYHVCFAPSNILLRKGDLAVRLLCHGSFYEKVDQDVLWDGVEKFVAPEVFNGGPIDARTDVYSLGKFIEYIYDSSGLPLELKRVVEKATAPQPENRFDSVESMHKMMDNLTSARRTATMAVVAIAIAAAIVGLFFYLLPSPEVVEYVKPVEEPIPDEMVEEDPDLLLGIGADADSATIANIVSLQKQRKDSLGMSPGKMRQYNAKAEAIFRKQFTKQAEAIISDVYNTKNMNASEQNFNAKSKIMTDRLSKLQDELRKSTTLSQDRASGIASQVIEQLTEKKKAEMEKDYYGTKKQKDELDEEAKKGAEAAKEKINE